MKKIIGFMLSLTLLLSFPAMTAANTATADTPTKAEVIRLSGQNRYETATKIADSLWNQGFF